MTATTVSGLPILFSSRRKRFLRVQLERSARVYRFQIRAWVILDDHYHLLLKSRRGEDLPRLIARVHLSTTHQFNLWDGVETRTVWKPVEAAGLFTSESFWRAFNGIHLDPLSHGYTGTLGTYRYSSYMYYLQSRGQVWMEKCLDRFQY
ncbi:MAG: transposase [Anaerolineales bacterium]|nr:transposase [Anaerolineales bacterium]